MSLEQCTAHELLEEHDWRPSHEALGLVGSFWKHVYPEVCTRCGAKKNDKGEIVPPRSTEE